MSHHQSFLSSRSSLTPTTSTSSTGSSTSETPTRLSLSSLKPPFFSWRVLGGIFATILVVAWVFIIVILIQEKKWQLVLVAWLLLYAAAHFCYWYFKRHHLLSLHSQICGRVRGNVGSVGPMEKGPDAPPSYEDIIKSEAPPPAYYSVVVESPKSSHKPASPSRFSGFSLPKVFGTRNSSVQMPSVTPRASTSSNASTNSNTSTSKCIEETKAYRPCCSQPSPPPSISGSLPPEQSFKWKSIGGYHQGLPPSYTDSFVDNESQVISPSHHSIAPTFSPSRRSSTRPGSRAESVINEGLHPIFSPIYRNNNNNNEIESAESPQISHTESLRRSSSAVQTHRGVERSCSTPN